MENLGKITAFLLIIVSAFLTALLATYIVYSIAETYHLKFITDFTFLQLYGIFGIVNLTKLKAREKDKPKRTFSESITNSFADVTYAVFMYLGMWGIAILSYHIIS